MCYSSESDNGARCTVVRTTSGVDVRHGSADIHQSPITIHDSRRDGSMATSESERMLGLIDDTCCVNGSAEGEQRMDRARRIVHNGKSRLVGIADTVAAIRARLGQARSVKRLRQS